MTRAAGSHRRLEVKYLRPPMLTQAIVIQRRIMEGDNVIVDLGECFFHPGDVITFDVNDMMNWRIE